MEPNGFEFLALIRPATGEGSLIFRYENHRRVCWRHSIEDSASSFSPDHGYGAGSHLLSFGELVLGASVLDLFAGSGAYGIEALSRGAAAAVFVDDHPKSIEAIRSNLSGTKLVGKVIRDDAFRFLEKQNEQYRLVFADPPYLKRREDRDYVRDLMENKSLAAAIEPEGLLVLECSPNKEVDKFRLWEITRAKKYGATRLLFCIPKRLPD